MVDGCIERQCSPGSEFAPRSRIPPVSDGLPRNDDSSLGGTTSMVPVRLLLSVTRQASSPEHDPLKQCPVCDHELELHQPDADLPHRILALCDNCGGWFLLDAEVALIVQVPWVEIFRMAGSRSGWLKLLLQKPHRGFRRR